MASCPNCGAAVDEADAFCQQCGATLGQSLGDGAAGGSPSQPGQTQNRGATSGPPRGQQPQQAGQPGGRPRQQSSDLDRRTALKVGGGLAVLGAVGAGWLFVGDDESGSTDAPTPGGETVVATTPSVTFEVTFDLGSAGGAATVQHTAGEPLDPARTVFEIDGTTTRQRDWDVLTTAAEITAGDTVTVELLESEYGGTLAVVWEGEDDHTAILEDFSIPS